MKERKGLTTFRTKIAILRSLGLRGGLFLALSMVVETAARRCLIWSKIVSTCFDMEEASVKLSNSFTGMSAFKRALSKPNLVISSLVFSDRGSTAGK